MTYFSPNYATSGICAVLFYPYAHGGYNLGKTFEGLCSCCDEGPSLGQRVKHFGAGIGMVIPLVNIVVFLAIRHFSNLEDDSVFVPPANDPPDTQPSGGSSPPQKKRDPPKPVSDQTLNNQTDAGVQGPNLVLPKNVVPIKMEEGGSSSVLKSAKKTTDLTTSSFIGEHRHSVSSTTVPSLKPPAKKGAKNKGKTKVGGPEDIQRVLKKASSLEQRIAGFKKQKKQKKEARKIEAQFDLEITQTIKELTQVSGEVDSSDTKSISALQQHINTLQKLKFTKSRGRERVRKPRAPFSRSANLKLTSKNANALMGEIKNYVLALNDDLADIRNERTNRANGRGWSVVIKDLNSAEQTVKNRALLQINAIRAHAGNVQLGEADARFLQLVLDQLKILLEEGTYLEYETTKTYLQEATELEQRIRDNCPERESKEYKKETDQRVAFLLELNRSRDKLLILKSLSRPDSPQRHAMIHSIRKLELLASEKLIYRGYDRRTRLELQILQTKNGSKKNDFYKDWTPTIADSLNTKYPLFPRLVVIRQVQALRQGPNSLCGYYALFFLKQMIADSPVQSPKDFRICLTSWLGSVFFTRARYTDNQSIPYTSSLQDMQNLREPEIQNLVREDPYLEELRDRNDIYFFRSVDSSRHSHKKTKDHAVLSGFTGKNDADVLASCTPFIALGNIRLDERKLQDTIYIIFKSEKALHYLCVKVEGLLSDKWTLTYAHSGSGKIASGGGMNGSEHVTILKELAFLKARMVGNDHEADSEEED